jgi:hypothetical protein
MAQFQETLWCDGWGVEINGPPFSTNVGLYCCQDCSVGLECSCKGWAEQEDDRRNSSLPIASPTGDLY